ncbi:MAG: adenylate kinase family protein [Thermoplasmata archaeon]|nr:adenylate kinase family protein [Thermoplasmata archaeon]
MSHGSPIIKVLINVIGHCTRMFIILTGTPGTGKTTVAKTLASRGYDTVTVEELAREHNCLEEVDGELEVDVDKLAKAVSQPEKDTILEGHLAHFMPGRMNIILRCHPETIRKRLEERGYDSEKVQENVEAEAIDLILSESTQKCLFVFEIDATELSPENIVDSIERIMNGEIDDYSPGKVDWSMAVMEWY